jgi:two-component system, chemotaxis family, chemotaxis protein CheY
VFATVLLIDDSPSIRMLLRTVLHNAGYSVVEAGDGEEAIDKLDGRALAAIVCDLDMPRMNGLSFLRYLRQHPRYRSVPLMVLTTESRPEAKQAARSGGAQAFMNKPCTPTQLLAAVDRLCGTGQPVHARDPFPS